MIVRKTFARFTFRSTGLAGDHILLPRYCRNRSNMSVIRKNGKGQAKYPIRGRMTHA